MNLFCRRFDGSFVVGVFGSWSTKGRSLHDLLDRVTVVIGLLLEGETRRSTELLPSEHNKIINAINSLRISRKFISQHIIHISTNAIKNNPHL